MTDREAALRSLAPGDMFHGRSPTNRASLICLVTEVNDSTIFARRVTTQEDYQFDRQTGVALGDVPSKIDCVAPFPADVYDTFLALDRKYQSLLAMERSGIEIDLDQLKLTPAEHRALLFVDDHLEANPL